MAQDLMFIGCVHQPTSIGDTNAEKLALDADHYTKDSLKKAELQWIPVTHEHKPNQAVGVVLQMYNTPDGGKYVKGVVPRDTELGQHVASGIEKGIFFLSLNTVSDEFHNHSTGHIIQTRLPLEVAVTRDPKRQGCVILTDSLQNVDRGAWDPSQKWHIIKASSQEDTDNSPLPDLASEANPAQSSESSTADPLTSTAIPLMSSDSTMADAQAQAQVAAATQVTPAQTTNTETTDPNMDGVVPPADVLQKLAAGQGMQAEGMQQVLRTLAQRELQHTSGLTEMETKLQALEAEKAEMQKRLAAADESTQQQLMDNIAKFIKEQQEIARAARAAQAQEQEKSDADADAEKPADEMAGGSNVQDVYKEFVGTLTPDQMLGYNRLVQIECANSVNTSGEVQRLAADNVRLRQLLGASAGKASQVNDMLSQATPGSVGMATGSTASSDSRLPAGTPAATGTSSDDSGRPNKRSRSEVDTSSYFSSLMDEAQQYI